MKKLKEALIKFFLGIAPLFFIVATILVFAWKKGMKVMNITLRQSRLSGVARATFPDKQSHLVINYCIMF